MRQYDRHSGAHVEKALLTYLFFVPLFFVHFWNSLEECNVPLRQPFTPVESTVILLVTVFAGLCIAWVVSRMLTAKRIFKEPKHNAFEAAGEESVYFFFLSDSWGAWSVVIATLFVQIAIFGLFLNAASFDNGDGDFVYSYRCPVNTPECGDERAVGAYGWIMVRV